MKLLYCIDLREMYSLLHRGEQLCDNPNNATCRAPRLIRAVLNSLIHSQSQ